MSSEFGVAWMSDCSLPLRKSARGSPVIDPSKVNCPGERTLACESDVQYATLPPKPYW